MDPIALPVIETRNLSKQYDEIVALKSLDLQVRRHSIFGFLGPNGAGKTTTIKLLLGLARPTAGTARIFGMDVVDESVEIRKRVGYLAQDPRYYDYMSAREILNFTAHLFFKGPEDKIAERVAETLELVGLADKADRPVKGFSGGERQRLGIAQAQVNYPDLLVLDEPAASLDPQGRRDVLAVMERLRKYTTVFYSTHILDDVQRVSDTVAILNRGELVAQAPIEQLLAGSEGVVFLLQTRGAIDNVLPVVSAQPWVSGVTTEAANGLVQWHVSVTDEAAAEYQLQRLILADPEIAIREFGRQKFELEDVFLRLVGEGDSHGKQ